MGPPAHLAEGCRANRAGSLSAHQGHSQDWAKTLRKQAHFPNMTYPHKPAGDRCSLSLSACERAHSLLFPTGKLVYLGITGYTPIPGNWLSFHAKGTVTAYNKCKGKKRLIRGNLLKPSALKVKSHTITLSPTSCTFKARDVGWRNIYANRLEYLRPWKNVS